MLEAIAALGAAGEFFVAAREVAVVFRLDLAAFVLGHVPSPCDPLGAQRRETLRGIGRLLGVAPWPAAIVNADGLVRLQIAAEIFRRRETDLAERNAHVGMQLAVYVNAPRVRHDVIGALRFEGIFGRDHRSRQLN